MKTTATYGQSTKPTKLRSLICALGITAATLFSSATQAADFNWIGGVDGSGTALLTTANWSPAGVPGMLDNAIFDAAGTNTANLTINFGTIAGLFRVGSITMGPGSVLPRAIRNNNTAVNGVMELYGVGGVLLANNSSVQLSLLNQGGTSRPMVVRLAASGEISVANGGNAAQIVISSSIDQTNGAQGFTKTGAGILYLQGTNNTFTGSITNLAGAIKVEDNATFGNGTAPTYLAGGNIIIGADRSAGVPLANPMVMSADTIIYNDAGITGTSRTIPFSGPFSGNAGTLTIANFTLATGQTFITRLSGSFNFSRPVVVGGPFDTAGSFAVLQLYNSATNGNLTLSGDISGSGSIRRQGATTSAGGTAILTGNNTYSGGTLVTYGTLLVNNTVGTGTGSGLVTVTNAGVLGGTGTVGSTTVAFNGTVSPGNSNAVGKLTASDLTLNADAKYTWQISSATGTPGTAWDVITIGDGTGNWNDGGTSINPITIKVDSMGVAPTGWNSGIARDWVIIQAGGATSFDPSHFTVDTTSFNAPVQGIFSVNAVSGSLHLIYTPAADIVLNVPTGSQSQTALGYPTLSGTFGVLKIGNGEAVFTNPLNDYAGSTKIYAGTGSTSVDAMNGVGAFGASTTPLLLGNTLGNSNATLNINTAGVTIGRAVTVQGGSTGVKIIGTSVTSGATTNLGDISLLDNVALTAPAGGTAVFAGEISGTNGISKTGAGGVVLAVQNTYSGKTKILGGTLTIDAVNRMGALPVTVVDDQITLDGGTLEFTASTTASAAARGFRLDSGGGTFSVQGGTLTINGSISGAGRLVKVGPNRLDLNNVTNVYAGDTYIYEGDIALDDDGSFGPGTVRLYGGGIACTASRSTLGNFIPNALVMTNDTRIRTTGGTDNTSRIMVFSGSSITTSGGTLTITNGAATVTNNTFDVRFVGAGVNFSRPIVLDGGAGAGNVVQLFVGNSNGTPAQTFSGVISGNGRVRRSATVVTDAGTTIFTGANTYTGGTVVFAGTLLANNASGSATGPGLVTVSNFGVFGGTGTVSGPVQVQTNGIIAPGTSAGTLTLQAGLDLSVSGTYAWELGANSTSSPGVNFDVIALTGGNLVLGGASKLSINFTGSATAPDATNAFWQSAHTWTIATLSGGAANPGSTKFTTIVNGTYPAGSFTNYTDGGGNVILAFVPGVAVPPPVIKPAIAGANIGNATITWSSVSGGNYTVQYKTNLNQVGWLTLGSVTAGGSTASIQDNSGVHAERYYRVISP